MDAGAPGSTIIVRCRPARRRRGLAGALVLLCAFAASSATAFELTTLGAERVALADYVGGGKWTLVMLWTTDCVPCEAQKPMIQAFHSEHADTDARVVSVALDGPAMIREIEAVNARHAASYPVLVAFDDVFHEQFEALTGKPFRATPTYLLYSPDGHFSGAHVGPIERRALDEVVSAR